MKMTQKKIEKLVDAAYYRHFDCVQVNIMDLGRIHRGGCAAYAAGGDVGLAAFMAEAVVKYGIAR